MSADDPESSGARVERLVTESHKMIGGLAQDWGTVDGRLGSLEHLVKGNGDPESGLSFKMSHVVRSIDEMRDDMAELKRAPMERWVRAAVIIAALSGALSLLGTVTMWISRGG